LKANKLAAIFDSPTFIS